MQVYCPSCGSPNETRPGGGKVMCTTCTAVFNAPGPEQKPPPPPPSGEVVETRPTERSEIPVGQLRPASAARGIQFGPSGKWSVWSLVSLGTGLVCCIPVVGGAAALITGALAIRDIKRDPKLRGYPLAVIGLVLGALGVLWTILVFLSSDK